MKSYNINGIVKTIEEWKKDIAPQVKKLHFGWNDTDVQREMKNWDKTIVHFFENLDCEYSCDDQGNLYKREIIVDEHRYYDRLEDISRLIAGCKDIVDFINKYSHIPYYANYFNEMDIKVSKCQGKTLKEMCELCGLSATRIKQILYRIQHKINTIKEIERIKQLTKEEKYKAQFTFLNNVRFETRLKNNGIYTYEQLINYNKYNMKKLTYNVLRAELEYVGFDSNDLKHF